MGVFSRPPKYVKIISNIFRGKDFTMKRVEFFSKVYKIVERIPKGKVMTYGQIALILGEVHGARRVGQAMYNTPEYLEIPAHRVINSKGELAPAHVFGGEGAQRNMLEAEGVVFKQNGCVDLKKSITMSHLIHND